MNAIHSWWSGNKTSVTRDEWDNSFRFCRRCQVEHEPEESIAPHRCIQQVSSCRPGTSNTEMVELCENGPPNLQYGPSDQLYRNQFCAECWKNGGSDSVEEEKPLEWVDSSSYTLATLQPIIQNRQISVLDFLAYGHQPRYLSTTVHSVWNNLTEYWYQSQLLNVSKDDKPSWDLGSLRCESELPNVCAHFIKYPTDEMTCGGPGCGVNQVQDAFGFCVNLSKNVAQDWRKDLEHIWPKWLLLRYQNRCSSQGLRSCQ